MAIGDIATGVIAVGWFARGVVALGGLAVGGIALGGCGAGLLGIGGLALGYLAAGGLAIGYGAIGGLAIGYYAVGGAPLGRYVMGPLHRDSEAVAFLEHLLRAIFRSLRWFRFPTKIAEFFQPARRVGANQMIAQASRLLPLASRSLRIALC